MKFGIVDQVFYDEYLSDHTCSSCNQNYSTKLVIYCRAFATGFTWWAWKKQGYIECNSCGAISDIKTVQHNGRAIQSAFSLKSLPVRYFLPGILIGSLSAILLLGLGVSMIAALTTTTRDRFAGIWEDRSHGYSFFVFPDNHYTLMTGDTILFGNYTIDNTTNYISIPVTNQINGLSRIDPEHLPLNLSLYEVGYFVKTAERLRGNNPYAFKYNQWRVKANHEESPAEVKQRVLGYLRYVQMRYRWALQNRLDYLPADLYSPLMTAENGIGINQSSLNNWAPVFYSEENLKLANRFLYLTFPGDIQYDVSEPNAYKRNLKGIDHYIQVAEATDIASARFVKSI